MKKHHPRWSFLYFTAKGRETECGDKSSSFKRRGTVDAQRLLLDHFVRIFPARIPASFADERTMRVRNDIHQRGWNSKIESATKLGESGFDP
jgi:hypothetical protein